ncbi:MAG TPA: hypothetical protein VEU33_17835 [Archangium sp.]|nr:hypothetical protein [Archangium sp.]
MPLIPRRTFTTTPCASFLLLSATLGCGSAGQGLHGVYAVTGTAYFSIQDLGHSSTQVSDTFHVSEGTTSDLLLTDAAGRCLLLADVEEERALLRPGGSCTYPGDNGLTVTVTLTRGTFSLSGGSGRLDMAGAVTASAWGRRFPGSFFQNATLTRVRGPAAPGPVARPKAVAPGTATP